MTDSVQIIVEEIRLRRFRAFENARLSLSDLTFLVGRNGAGKSSLLDAVELLREAVSDSLENALDRRGGLHKVQRAKSGKGRKPLMGLAVVLRIVFASGRQAQAVYGFEVQGITDASSSHIRECFISSKETSFERRDKTFTSLLKSDVSPPAGNLVLPLIARSDSLWEFVLNSIRNLRAYELSPAHMAAAQEIGERSTLDRDGANAGDVLKAVEGSDAHRWINERIGIITDAIDNIHAHALLGRRVVQFVQRQGRGKITFDASQVSQGTLRSLGILLSLKQNPSPSLVLIDEIENSVHPSALAVLLDAASASSNGMRVVLTSHSPEVLSHPAATGERIRVVEWRDGESRIYRLSKETQDSVNQIDTVGWMLRSNTLWSDPHPEIFKEDLFALDGGSK
jgi:predicted ATPase